MQRLKRTLIYMLAPVICALLCIGTVFSSSKTLSAYAAPTSEETIDFGTDGITVDTQSSVKALITELGGTSYDDLSTKLGSGAKDASDFAEAKTVTLGGVEFNITYVSKADYTANGTTAGDIIVTLWMAQSEIESQWNTVASDTPEDKYPTNMYSSSLIRSTLVGTPYLTEAGAETLEGTGEINGAWLPFNDGGAYYNYLATPANMAWQETLSAEILSADENFPVDDNCSNEAWGTPSGGSFYAGYDYSEKDGYAGWQHDRIWLPAMSEIGNYGLWSTNAAQRSNTSMYWLRSGGNRNAKTSFFWDSNGGNGGALTFGILDVRPAVHLNLKSLLKFEVTINDATTKYATIEEAFLAGNKASTAATVKMLADAQTKGTLGVNGGKNITLDLNGHMLKYNNDAANKSVIDVSGTFTLVDSDKTTSHTILSPVTTQEVIICGGLVTGGTGTTHGGGVYVSGSDAKFTMESGTISGNTAGVNGGGVFVSSGTLIITGGTISGNTAGVNGGGVFFNNGTFEMSGAPDITGNKIGNSDNNVELNSHNIIAVTGALEEGAQIGIYDTGAVATGFTQEGNPADYFIPDNPANNCISVSDGTVTIGTHAWNDGTETTPPTCTEEGEKTFTCTKCGATKTEPVDALGHNLTHHGATPATVDEEGNTEYWSCGDCGDYFEDGNGERVIDDKTSVILPKLTPSAPAQPKAGMPWWAWLLIVLAVLAVVGVALGVWLYKKKKED